MSYLAARSSKKARLAAMREGVLGGIVGVIIVGIWDGWEGFYAGKWDCCCFILGIGCDID